MTNKNKYVSTQSTPVAYDEIVNDLKALGILPEDNLLVHSSLSSLGWVVGGAQTLVDALLESVKEGTLVMPTHTTGNTDPSNWSNPPVPDRWWASIRENMPAYDPLKTPTRGMGVVPELFRSYPRVTRSDHPVASFAAFGPLAESLTKAVPFQPEFGQGSLLDRLRNHNAKVLLLGVGHDSNTSLHLSEHLSDFTEVMVEEGCAMTILGQRKWARYKMLALETDDFHEIGAAFEKAFHGQLKIVHRAKVANADSLLFDLGRMVEFGTDWMNQNRP